MTYDTNLAAVEQEEIPELYDFEYGGTYDRYTSYSEDLTFQGFTYTRAAIKRSGFSMDTEFGKVSMKVQAPIIPSLSAYIANQPIEVTHLTIWRALLSDLTDYRVLFKGDVLRVSVKGPIAQAMCESQSQILAQKLPNIIYQSYCNWQVFDDGCGLDDSAWVDTGVITTISGSQYTSGTFGLKADGYYTGGTMYKDNDARYITNHVGNDVWLHVPFDSRVTTGTTVSILPGCDGAAGTCKTKFNNFTKRLAFPYIPDSNPVMWGFK